MYSREKIQLFKDCFDLIYKFPEFMVFGGSILYLFYFDMYRNTKDIDILFTKEENKFLALIRMIRFYIISYIYFSKKGYSINLRPKFKEEENFCTYKRIQLANSLSIINIIHNFLCRIFIYDIYIKSKKEEVYINFGFLVRGSLLPQIEQDVHPNIQKLGFYFKARTISHIEAVAIGFAAAINRKTCKDLYNCFSYMTKFDITDEVVTFIAIYMYFTNLDEIYCHFEDINDLKYKESIKLNPELGKYSEIEYIQLLKNFQSKLQKLISEKYSKFVFSLLDGDTSFSYMFNINNLQSFSSIKRIAKTFKTFKKLTPAKHQEYSEKIKSYLNK